jgi:hypothetical protein
MAGIKRIYLWLEETGIGLIEEGKDVKLSQNK